MRIPDCPTHARAVRVFAFGCGRCLEVQRAGARPDACFRCGARFGRGLDDVREPLAVAAIEVVAGRASALAASVGIHVRTRIDFEGAWTAEARERVRAQLVAPGASRSDDGSAQEGDREDRPRGTVDGG